VTFRIRGSTRAVCFTALLACGLALPLTAAQAVSLSGFHNTGVDDEDMTLSFGSVDTHYNAIGGGTSFVTPADPGSIAAPAGSGWIAIGDDPLDRRFNAYWLRFNAAPGEDEHIADLTLRISFASGGRTLVYLNGDDTGIRHRGDDTNASIGTYDLDGSIREGDNYLVFVVRNRDGDPNAGGLLVTGATAHMPEPSAALLFGLGFAAVGAAKRRRGC
jgi:hypothetical protein